LLQMRLRGFGTLALDGGATFASSAISPLGPDGSFQLAGLPSGTLNLALVAFGNRMPPKGFMLTRIERDGVVLQRGLEVKDGDQLVNVRVFVSFGTATLRGA